MKLLHLPLFITLWLISPPPALSGDPCAITSSGDEQSGFIELNGEISRRLYWKILPAKSQKKKGSAFFLAGGPITHLFYMDIARAYQNRALPDYDFVLYDYYGTNCSNRAQNIAMLHKQSPYFQMPQMARDLIALKKHLVGEKSRVVLIGGSHGAMLGAQVIANFPNHVEKAILYSGATKPGWLKSSWPRFDRILQDKVKRMPTFGQDLEVLLKKCESGEVSVTINKKLTLVTREMLEVILWLTAAQDSTAQAKLPLNIKNTLDGDLAWITEGVTVYNSLLIQVSSEPPPTYQSLITNFHRCNVWMPKSNRITSRRTQTKYLKYESFFFYWNQICSEYDAIGEFPLSISVSKPTNVPILVWLGKLDHFDPLENERSWRKLSSRVIFQLEPTWSHDFGPDPSKGFAKVSEMIKKFLRLQGSDIQAKIKRTE